ncbi:hypothetical protein FRC08_001487 [Ceratobasidium sp. 394]|nr:hypothetical protein FRC08_001487 [Ceratobasidium sp. 394]
MRLEHVLCVGIVPGPKQCKDLNSYLIPVIEELLELERGLNCGGFTPDGNEYNFVLRAFIIIIFGDIPALTKLLLMKGHNGITPCRACYMQGTRCNDTTTYYIPLKRPNARAPFPLDKLPMRTPELFRRNYEELEAKTTEVAREEYRKDTGVTGRSILTRLQSIDLPSSAPYDIMHLLFENLVPNMVRHWTGTFKELGAGRGNYELEKGEWERIGQITTQATRTIPAAFVGPLPDIAQSMKLYKAEAFSFWIQHLLLLREIIMRCLQYEITSAQIDELQTWINTWVNDYEKYYYQYSPERLPACPLTIHALLHMPYYLRRTGPLWASWAFVMERFCGHLLPAIKNRVRPYEHLDNFVQRRAQMHVVSRIHNLPTLTGPRIKYQLMHGVQISSREIIHLPFQTIVLGTPVTKRPPMTKQLKRLFTDYFRPTCPELETRELEQRLHPDSLIRYGRFRITGDSDRIRTAALIDNNPDARDNSFIKYDLLPDRNAAYRHLVDRPYRRTHYGRLMDIYYIEFTGLDDVRAPYVLLSVRECKTDGSDAVLPEHPVVAYTQLATAGLIHVDTVVAVVGRVRIGNTWAIVDRSRGNVRTRFVDEEGNDDYE